MCACWISYREKIIADKAASPIMSFNHCFCQSVRTAHNLLTTLIVSFLNEYNDLTACSARLFLILIYFYDFLSTCFIQFWLYNFFMYQYSDCQSLFLHLLLVDCLRLKTHRFVCQRNLSLLYVSVFISNLLHRLIM